MADSISFARGAPSLDIIDVEGLKAAAGAAFDRDPAGTTAYGTSVGYVPLRRWIAEKHGVDEAQVIVTNGSMQADAFLFDALVREGDEVVVEKPTYDRTLLGLRERGADIRMVELQRDGIDTTELAALLSGGLRPVLAHIIPNFQNPAGYTLSLAKREALLALAAEHGFTLFEDDPYIDIRFTGESLPTMLSMNDGGARVVYASSFSKTICPGIRCGYLVGPEDLIAKIVKAATNTYISPDMVAQSIVYEFCSSGRVDRSIATVKEALKERCATPDRGARARAPAGHLHSARGRLLHVGRAPRGHKRRRSLHRSRRARPAVRQGRRLPARRRREHPANRLLRRHSRTDRRRRHPTRRRLPLTVGRKPSRPRTPRAPTPPQARPPPARARDRRSWPGSRERGVRQHASDR